MLNKFFYNGHWSDEFGIKVETPPTIIKPARKFQSASVMGRNGNIYAFQNAYDEVIVSYKINAGSAVKNVNQTVFASIAEWLNGADGYSILKDTYDTIHYRMAVFVDSVSIENLRTMYGKATINFRCRPERFLLDQTEQVESGDTITNETNHDASPLITLTGGGIRNLLKMQGRNEYPNATMTSDASLRPFSNWTNFYIRGIRDSVNSAPCHYNSSKATLVSADDSTGTLTMRVNTDHYGIGFPVKAEPNTEYTVAWDSVDDFGYITVYFYGSSYISQAFTIDNTSLTFRTPSECQYMVIAFTTDSAEKNKIFTPVMVNSGNEAKPFRAYAEPSENIVQINDTILKITSSGFGTAEIDCDKENVTIDGVNGNPLTQVTDQYGNLSVQYLGLKAGENTVTFSGDIASVTVDPMTWEL